MSLRVDLTGSGTGFKQMLDAASAQVNAFSKTVTHQVGSSWGGIGKGMAAGLAGMFTVDAVKNFVGSTIDAGERIKQLSEQMNMNADDIQKWDKAMNKAGMSIENLIPQVAKLQELKEAAKKGTAEGVSAREQLNALGISNDAILTPEGFSGQQIADIFGNANKGAEQRSKLSEVIGTRGLKVAAGAKNFAGATPDWDAHDREAMEEAKNAERAAKRFETKTTVGVWKMLTDWDFAKTSLKERGKQIGWAFTGMDYGPFSEGGMFNRGENTKEAALPLPANLQAEKGLAPLTRKAHAIQRKREAEAARKKQADAEAKEKAEADASMSAYVKTQEQEKAKQVQSAEFGLHQAQGRNLTIGDRRDLIAGDLGKITQEISARAAAQKAGKLYGLSDAENAAEKKRSPSEYAGKLHQQKLALIGEQTKAESMRGELKDKPLSFNADSMSKVGLYSASAVAFNPLLGIARKTNELLTQISRNTSGGYGKLNDPNSP